MRIKKERPAGDGGIIVDRDGIIEVLEIGQGAMEELHKLKRMLGPKRLGALYLEAENPPNWMERSEHG